MQESNIQHWFCLNELRKLLQSDFPAGVINYNINDVLNRQQNRPRNPTTTGQKTETMLVLPFLEVQSKIVTKQLKTCINKFYGCIDPRVIFQSANRIKSFCSTKILSTVPNFRKLIMKLVVVDCQDFYIGKTKRTLHDRKSEHFKGIRSTCHASILANHVTSTGHNLKWTSLRY